MTLSALAAASTRKGDIGMAIPVLVRLLEHEDDGVRAAAWKRFPAHTAAMPRYLRWLTRSSRGQHGVGRARRRSRRSWLGSPNSEQEARRRVTDSLVSELLAARDSLSAGSNEDALHHLLTAWRTLRAAELAVLVERTARRIRRPPVSAKKTMQAGFLERARAKDPADLDVLLAILCDARALEARERLETIARGPPDPRTSTRLLEYLNRPPITGSSGTSLMCRMLEIIVAIGDPRAAAVLGRIATNTSETLQAVWRTRRSPILRSARFIPSPGSFRARSSRRHRARSCASAYGTSPWMRR